MIAMPLVKTFEMATAPAREKEVISSCPAQLTAIASKQVRQNLFGIRRAVRENSKHLGPVRSTEIRRDDVSIAPSHRLYIICREPAAQGSRSTAWWYFVIG